MEDNSEYVRDERNRKPVFDNRSCPQCGNKVGWKRLYLKAWVRAKWECPVCDSLLGFDFDRRLVVALGLGLLGFLPGLYLFKAEPLYLKSAWIVVVTLYISTFERIKTVRPRVPKGTASPHREAPFEPQGND